MMHVNDVMECIFTFMWNEVNDQMKIELQIILAYKQSIRNEKLGKEDQHDNR